MRNSFAFLTLLSISLIAVQCQDQIPDNSFREFTILEKQLLQSDNIFGFKLFRNINENQTDQNIFISPLSVSMALGMTLNGARDSTYQVMRSMLELNGMTQEEINRSYRSLIQLLRELNKKVIFEIANSIWFRKELQVEKKFIDDNRAYFDAEIASLNFEDPASLLRINQWVHDKTRGRVDKIIDRLNPDLVMLLLNAIYFKGTWTYEFDKNDTYDEYFLTHSGSSVSCKMMKQYGSFDYLSTDKWQAVDLPYGNGDFSMIVLLPNPNVDINEVIGDFNPDNVDALRSSVSQGTVEIPKILLEYDLTLNEVLKAMGMNVAFEPGVADFSGISEIIGRELYISKVKHKSFVEINEEGTEAAAVTSVEIGITSIGDGGFHFKADRPFLFFIRENRSRAVLFIGKIVDPS